MTNLKICLLETNKSKTLSIQIVCQSKRLQEAPEALQLNLQQSQPSQRARPDLVKLALLITLIEKKQTSMETLRLLPRKSQAVVEDQWSRVLAIGVLVTSRSIKAQLMILRTFSRRTLQKDLNNRRHCRVLYSTKHFGETVIFKCE